MSKSHRNYLGYLARMKKAPRITTLSDTFDLIARGKSGQPHSQVKLDKKLLHYDRLALSFADVRQKNAGFFNAHYVASLPYILEEQCRLGAALLLYSKQQEKLKDDRFRLYTLGDASGVMARSITEMAHGKISTLTCSPNRANKTAFYASNPAPEAHFFLGPFFEVCPASLRDNNLAEFVDGFDVIIEDTTFQMYGPERLEPITLACRNLKDDGIFVMIEKFCCEDIEEYIRREKQKDYEFKNKYFSEEQIEEKRSEILEIMQRQEVTLYELTAALKSLFKSAIILWNSGNFYTVAASNDLSNLKIFSESFLPPAIPEQFIYEKLPKVLFGDIGCSINFRSPDLGN